MRRPLRRARSALALLLGLAALLVGLVATPASAASEYLFEGVVPDLKAVPDTASVTLGTTITTNLSGTLTSIRFYKGTGNTGTHVGAVFSSSGTMLARGAFANETTSGWQTWTPTSPLAVKAGTRLVVAVTMPDGHYAAANDYTWPRSSTSLTATSGVYTYGSGLRFPSSTYRSSSYFIDAGFKSDALAPPTTSPSPSPTSPSDSPMPSASPTATATVTPTPPASPNTAITALPRVPWSGGNDYWSRFPKAKAAGWSDQDFFPIALWYGSAGNDAQVKFDKAHGINTYVQNSPSNPYSLLKSNNMFSLYKASEAPSDDTQQVGVLLDDEVDGRYSDAEGIAHLTRAAADMGGAGRFTYVNYTSGIVTYDRSIANSAAFLNGSFNDVIGVDQYFYSNPHCDTLSLRWRTPSNGTAIDRNNCRTASSYGKVVELQHEVNVTSGSLKPVWAFVEVVSPAGGNTAAIDYHQPTGAQIKGAAWNSIIHGAAGIDWFSQAPDGGSNNDCPTGDALRDARQGSGCAAIKANVEAMGQVNNQIQSLAPVLNTQSYAWSFGSGIDSALKVKDGSAYVFAMTKDGGTGSRTFTLPNGVWTSTVEVVGEGRTLPVTNGSFADNFGKESDVHIYRLSI